MKEPNSSPIKQTIVTAAKVINRGPVKGSPEPRNASAKLPRRCPKAVTNKNQRKGNRVIPIR